MRRLVRAAALLSAAALALAAGGLLWFVGHVRAPVAASPPAPGIAVLTGGPDRVEAGLALLAARDGARLIISGAGRDATLSDIIRRAEGEDAALPSALAARVTVGREATSTRGNAREVAAWARAGNLPAVTVVTAGYHMPRALLELGRAMPGVALRPHPVPPHRPRAAALLREYAKLVGAVLGLSAAFEERRGR